MVINRNLITGYYYIMIAEYTTDAVAVVGLYTLFNVVTHRRIDSLYLASSCLLLRANSESGLFDGAQRTTPNDKTAHFIKCDHEVANTRVVQLAFRKFMLLVVVVVVL